MEVKMSELSKYEKLGVDPDKSTVREIFGAIIDNDYPGAFVNIVQDPFDSSRVLTQHQDGDGSKFVQRALHYHLMGGKEIFRYMVDDALSMNTGDIAASGFVFGPWMITDVLNVGFDFKLGYKETIMRAVAIRMQELKELYVSHGFTNIKFLGGETADLPDQVKSGVFDMAITAWADKKDLITGNVEPGDKIYGFASDGQAKWEIQQNSGIMSNGLTLARCSLMSREYNQFSVFRRDGEFYEGRFLTDDRPDILNGLSVSEAILSPTRQWAIVIHKVLSYLKSMNCLSLVHGISMNTGGGATKIRNVGRGGIIYYKKMPTPPPLFRLIQEETKENWSNMYKTFNCGVGLDFVGKDDPRLHETLKQVSRECKITLYELGDCEFWAGPENKVQLETNYGAYEYEY
ncbi:MAG: hypothetical protein ABH951_00105 [Patescibacteria group bacterium]